MTDEESYLSVLKKVGMTEEQVQEQVHRRDVLNVTFSSVYLESSKIHGTGCFASKNLIKGCIIAPARIRDMRTVVGRYTNHAANPNAFSKVIHDSFVIIARRAIPKGEEITLDYLQVAEVNKQAGQ